MRHRMEQLEASNRVSHERLHDTKAAIAGVVAAWHLLHDGHVPDGYRARLERMIDSEMARLAGLAEPRTSATEQVDLDQTVDPVVTAQRVLGRSIEWSPSGHRANGRPDEIAEILTTLLDNAARHAPGSPVWISTRDLGTCVELTVSDAGPGVAPEVADRVFTWGARGPDSHGEGIGLCVAQRLAEGMRGALTWAPLDGRGATFVLTLELARKGHGATSVAA